MLEMIQGCSVPFPEKLSEGYELHQGDGGAVKNYFIANVNASKTETLFRDFITAHNEPLFFILEIPCNINEETPNEEGVYEHYYKNVYYIDGLSREEAAAILEQKGSLLIHDGLSCFGFGGHESQDEIMQGKYGIITAFTQKPEVFRSFFEEHDIPQAEHLITAWDTFSADNPGMSRTYAENGGNIYDLPAYFKDWGIYLAERRVDD